MITGFNTDIEHDGVVYHVQTEDKGLNTPIILSLVYTGGTILASKRAPYRDLIDSGFSDEALAERLKRQHKLICAAIHSGRINDLKKMSARQEGTPAAEPVPTAESAPTAPLSTEFAIKIEEPVVPDVAPPPVEQVVADPEIERGFEIEPASEIELTPEVELAPEIELAAEIEPTPVEPETSSVASADEVEFEFDFHNTQEWKPPTPVQETEAPVEEEKLSSLQPPSPSPKLPIEAAEAIPYTIYDPRRQHVLEHVEPEIGLVITFLDEEEFYAGENRTVRVLVTDYTGNDHKPLGSVTVSIKILGTAFRPLIYSVKTEKDGVAIIATQIPLFTSGRAAVLVRAVSKDKSAELRRVIHPRRG